MRTLRAASLVVLLGSCTGQITNNNKPTCPPPAGTNSQTERIRLGLAPTCAGCHSAGDTGYFASATAFDSLLARNPRLVSPGNPDASELIALLEGRRANSSQKQMPLSGDPFSKLDTDGKTSIHLEDVRAWVTSLEVPGVSGQADPGVSSANRIDATFVEFGLRELLGLEEADFYRSIVDYGVPNLEPLNLDVYDLHSPDRAPGQRGNGARYTALGGAAATTSAHVDTSISTSFAQTLIPLSQQWCGMAVRKPGNRALFTVATAATRSGDRAAVRAQLADWYLLFLSEVPTEADLDDVVNGVFVPLDTANPSPEAAWIGACSYFVRHPLFIFY